MNALQSLRFSVLLATVLGSLLTMSNAIAVVKNRVDHTNPTGICQSAMPVYDVSIRKRPLAVQNEGEASAFVTCSFTAQDATTQLVGVFFSSEDLLDHEFSCTGVSGTKGSTPSPQYIVKNIIVAGNGAQMPGFWVGQDFAGAPVVFPNQQFSISCNLPPGVGINQTQQHYSEDVGA